MTLPDLILTADAYEEQSAHAEMRAAARMNDGGVTLARVWELRCEHWPEGAARDRLDATYRECAARVWPVGRAG